MTATGPGVARTGLILALALALCGGCDDDGVGGLLGSRGAVISPMGEDSYFSHRFPGPLVQTDGPIPISWVGIPDSTVTIYFSADGGDTWTVIAESISPIFPGGFYSWDIDVTAVSSTCMIRVVGEGSGEEADSAEFSLDSWYGDNDSPINDLHSTAQVFPLVENGGVAWGDYNGDGLQDIAIQGQDATNRYTSLFLSAGTLGGFSSGGNTGMNPVANRGSIAWTDFNPASDNFLDLVVAGSTSSGTYEVSLYANSSGSLPFASLGSVTLFADTAVAWGDVDNDGDRDLAITGYNNALSTEQVYLVRAPSFYDVTILSVPGVQNGAIAWGDADNDGDMDLAIAGLSASGNSCRIYWNDGGNIERGDDLGTGFYDCDLAWVDYDTDGDLDLSVTGRTTVAGTRTTVYRNDGGGIFNDATLGLTGVADGALAWADFDADGDYDVAIAGLEEPAASAPQRIGIIYRQRREEGFDTPWWERLDRIQAVSNCDLAWGNYEDETGNDRDLDLAIIGHTGTTHFSMVYRSGYGGGTPPTTPGRLRSYSTDTGMLTMSWARSSDLETPSAGLTYNLWVRRYNDADIMSPMVRIDPATDGPTFTDGRRLVPGMGNVQTNLSWTLYGLVDGIYYWRVQAVDPTGRESAWSDEQETEYVP